MTSQSPTCLGPRGPRCISSPRSTTCTLLVASFFFGGGGRPETPSSIRKVGRMQLPEKKKVAVFLFGLLAVNQQTWYNSPWSEPYCKTSDLTALLSSSKSFQFRHNVPHSEDQYKKNPKNSKERWSDVNLTQDQINRLGLKFI